MANTVQYVRYKTFVSHAIDVASVLVHGSHVDAFIRALLIILQATDIFNTNIYIKVTGFYCGVRGPINVRASNCIEN